MGGEQQVGLDEHVPEAEQHGHEPWQELGVLLGRERAERAVLLGSMRGPAARRRIERRRIERRLSRPSCRDAVPALSLTTPMTLRRLLHACRDGWLFEGRLAAARRMAAEDARRRGLTAARMLVARAA